MMRQGKATGRIFFGLAILNLCIVYVMLFTSKGQYVIELTYSESNFVDFWSHIGRLLFSPNVYSTDVDAIFPPLAYLFLKLFARPLAYKAEQGDSLEQISNSGYGILVVLMYLLLYTWLFMIAIHLFYQKGTFFKKMVLSGILLFSYSVWGFAFERGNLVLYAMVFLMLGLALRDSPDKALREASLIFVAIAAGFKLYPAIFGFLWIAEKRYKEAARLVLYGVLAFFLPFPFVDSFTNYLHTFSGYLDKKVYSHASVWGLVINRLGDDRYTQILCRIMVAVIILWALFLLFADGINWKTITLLMATQTTIIPEQYVYTYVFIAIPLVCFLNEAGGKKLDYVYAVLFSALFTMPPAPFWGGRGRVMVWIWTILLIVVSVDEVIFLVKKKRSQGGQGQKGFDGYYGGLLDKKAGEVKEY